MKGKYVITSSIFLMAGAFIYEGGNKEKVYIENLFIVVIGIALMVIAFALKETALVYTGTKY